MQSHYLYPSELHTIIAALRYYLQQGQGCRQNRSPDIQKIASNDGEVLTLRDQEIEKLIEQLLENPSATYRVVGPDLRPIDSEPYSSINDALQAAAGFPLRHIDKGHFRDAMGNVHQICDLPSWLHLVTIPPYHD